MCDNLTAIYNFLLLLLGDLLSKPLSKNTSLFRVLKLIATCLFPCFVFATSDDIETLHFYDPGLGHIESSSSAYDAVKGPYGYYWLGTASGLKRYDGKNILDIHSNNHEPLFNKAVEYLKLQDNSLWLGGPTGLYRLDLDSYQIQEFSSLKNKYVMRISLDDNSNVWVGTLNSGLYRFQENLKQFELIDLPKHKTRKDHFPITRSVATMPNGISWVATKNGLFAYNANQNTYVKKESYPPSWSPELNDLASFHIQDVMTTGTGNLIVSSHGFLYEFNSQYSLLKKITLPCNGVSVCELTSLNKDSKGGIWGRLGTNLLFKVTKDWNKPKLYRINNEQGSDTAISDFNISESGTLIVSAFDKPVIETRLDNGLVKDISLTNHNPLLVNFSPRISYQDQRGVLWMTDREWIVAYHPNTNELKSYKSPSSTISHLIVDSNFKVWIISALDHTLIRLDPKTSIFDNPVAGLFYFLEYSKQDGLWLGDDNARLIKMDIDRLVLESVNDIGCFSSITKVKPNIVEDDLLAWSDGKNLCKYNRLDNVFLKTKISLHEPSSFSGKLYYTDKLYYTFSPNAKTLQLKLSADGSYLKPANINSLSEASISDNVVFNRGVAWILNKKNNRLYQLNTANGKAQHYNFSEGMLRHDKSMLLGFDKEQLLVVSEPGRIASFDAKRLSAIILDNTLKIHLISILHEDGGERRYYSKQVIDLSYKDFSVEILFGNTRPKRNLSNYVYYRLKGHQDNWIKTKRDFVRFSGLPAGNYSFQMKTTNKPNSIVSMNINVEAPPWLRWWAYVVYSIIIISVLSIIVYQRIFHHRKLSHLASHDTLTNLPNRHYINNHILKLINNGTPFMLLFIDLDRFKNINDSLGHHVGDQLLVSIADRFSSCLAKTEIISRLGGDEFLVVLPYSEDCTEPSSNVTANRLLATVKDAIALENKSLHVSLSIGISRYPDDSTDAQVLLSCADAAMYYSKSRGGNRYSFYTQELGDASLSALNLESELYRGMKRQEFLPYYQAKVDVETGKCVGYEALARWLNPEKGIIEPGEFITTAERTGVIIEISWQIMHLVCQQVMLWAKHGSELPVALNVSPQQLALSDFSDQVFSIIEQYSIDPKLIQFEVTESMLLKDKDNSIKQLRLLRQRGHKIYVDDFGTGYSSLSYLKYLPIDVLKIDQSFVQDVLLDKNSKGIVTTIAYLAKQMNLDLVAEGVEDLATAEYLLSIGCPISQGFYYSMPLPADEANNYATSTPTIKLGEPQAGVTL